MPNKLPVEGRWVRWRLDECPHCGDWLFCDGTRLFCDCGKEFPLTSLKAKADLDAELTRLQALEPSAYIRNPLKPPLGVPPTYVWIELRKADLERAISEYTKEGFPVRPEWEIELAEINSREETK